MSTIYNFVCKVTLVNIGCIETNQLLNSVNAEEPGQDDVHHLQLRLQVHQLYEKYHSQGFSVLGFPCNQFGKQEPKSNEEIEQFARKKFNTTWDLFAKIDVNGDKADPLYKFLKDHKNGKGFLTNAIKWNFSKFLISREGDVVKRYGPKDDPLSIEKDIVRELNKKGTQM